MADIKSLRRYIGADPDMPEDEVTNLRLFLTAAISWWLNAGVEESEDDTELYDLGVYMLAAHWYNTRGATSAIDLKDVPHGIYSIKHQLEKLHSS